MMGKITILINNNRNYMGILCIIEDLSCSAFIPEYVTLILMFASDTKKRDQETENTIYVDISFAHDKHRSKLHL